MVMGRHFLAIFFLVGGRGGGLAIDKRRKKWLLTISIVFLLLDC